MIDLKMTGVAADVIDLLMTREDEVVVDVRVLLAEAPVVGSGKSFLLMVKC